PARRIAADETVHDLGARLADRLADHDGRLDVRADEPRGVPDGRIRPDIGLGSDDAVSPDHDGTANHAPGLDDGARPDPDAPLDPGPCLDRPLDFPLDVLQEEMVRLEDVFRLARVLPPARDDVGLELPPLDPQMVEGLRDLELVPPGRFEVVDDRENRGAEQVDPDEGEVALGRVRRLDEGDDVPLPADFRHADHLRVGDVSDHDVRV